MRFGSRRRRFNQKAIEPRLLTALELGEQPTPVAVIVRFRSANDRAKTITTAVRGAKHFRLTPSSALTLDPAEVAELSQIPGVVMIWPDAEVHTCLDRSVPLIGVPAIWADGYTGRGVRIAVIDTGADVTHPDLEGRIVATHDTTGEGFSDGSGHGTHVCGIAAGAGRVYRGVAPDAELVVAKVLKTNGFGQMSWVMDGVEWAVGQRVRVVNMSLGSGLASDGSDPLSQTCDAAVARGFTVCVAAGNDGPMASTIGSPGAARRVITVGASTADDLVADFSSRGPTSDGRVKPDLLFPGHGIISARARGTRMGQVVDELYTQASGTSMACPHAAGAAALLLQANPSLGPADIKALLMRTARDLGQPPNVQGRGRARVALAFGRDPGTVPRDPEPAPAPGARRGAPCGVLERPARGAPAPDAEGQAPPRLMESGWRLPTTYRAPTASSRNRWGSAPVTDATIGDARRS